MFRLMKSLAPSITVALLLSFAPLLMADDKVKDSDSKKTATPAKPKFMRILRNDKEEPLALQTATVRFKPESGEGTLVVDLIGVIHIGDTKYYEQLNKQFEQYDVLLYELVAPQGTRVPPKNKRKQTNNPLAMIHNLAKTTLELDSQLDNIDYNKKNFVHADLSPDEIAKIIKDRGDTGLTLFLSAAADMLRQQNLQSIERDKNGKGKAKVVEPEIDPFVLLFDPNGPMKMKRSMAEMFVMQGNLGSGLGKTIEQILIQDRNKAAMKVLQSEMAKGKKRIGIFYGAAHMPDFEKRLVSDFKLKRDTTKWLSAWDLRLKHKDDSTISDLSRILKLLQR